MIKEYKEQNQTIHNDPLATIKPGDMVKLLRPDRYYEKIAMFLEVRTIEAKVSTTSYYGVRVVEAPWDKVSIHIMKFLIGTEIVDIPYSAVRYSTLTEE